MFQVTDVEFHSLVNTAISELPKTHIDQLKNVAFIVEYYPSLDQRQKLKLADNQTLFGLYEGIPLSQRQGTSKLLPDKITLFKIPIEMSVHDIMGLRAQIKHTIWHEIAHYFGLDHEAISKLE
jgi:predicted Zn-dependent protease with MMP-like domain